LGFLRDFEEVSHESVRKYYRKLKYVLKEPKKKERKLIVVDEAIVRVRGRRVFVWLHRCRYVSIARRQSINAFKRADFNYEN